MVVDSGSQVDCRQFCITLFYAWSVDLVRSLSCVHLGWWKHWRVGSKSRNLSTIPICKYSLPLTSSRKTPDWLPTRPVTDCAVASLFEGHSLYFPEAPPSTYIHTHTRKKCESVCVLVGGYERHQELLNEWIRRSPTTLIRCTGTSFSRVNQLIVTLQESGGNCAQISGAMPAAGIVCHQPRAEAVCSLPLSPLSVPSHHAVPVRLTPWFAIDGLAVRL